VLLQGTGSPKGRMAKQTESDHSVWRENSETTRSAETWTLTPPPSCSGDKSLPSPKQAHLDRVLIQAGCLGELGDRVVLEFSQQQQVPIPFGDA